MACIIAGKANPALLLVLSGAIWIEFRRRGFDAVSIDMAFCSHYFRSMEHALYQIAKSVAELTAKALASFPSRRWRPVRFLSGHPVRRSDKKAAGRRGDPRRDFAAAPA
jgi:hypothetical protein